MRKARASSDKCLACTLGSEVLLHVTTPPLGGPKPRTLTTWLIRPHPLGHHCPDLHFPPVLCQLHIHRVSHQFYLRGQALLPIFSVSLMPAKGAGWDPEMSKCGQVGRGARTEVGRASLPYRPVEHLCHLLCTYLDFLWYCDKGHVLWGGRGPAVPAGASRVCHFHGSKSCG